MISTGNLFLVYICAEMHILWNYFCSVICFIHEIKRSPIQLSTTIYAAHLYGKANHSTNVALKAGFNRKALEVIRVFISIPITLFQLSSLHSIHCRDHLVLISNNRPVNSKFSRKWLNMKNSYNRSMVFIGNIVWFKHILLTPTTENCKQLHTSNKKFW